MKRWLATLLLVLPLTSISSEKILTATEIIERSDQQMRGESSYTVSTMNIVRPDWTRSMSMKSWSKGQDLSLVLVTAPVKTKAPLL